MRRARAAAAVALALTLVRPGRSVAYETNVHEKMTEAAVFAAQMYRDPNVLGRFGLTTSSDFPNAKKERKTVLDLVKEGSILEDDFPRPLNHFFDPLTGAGVTSVAYPSPDWALEDRGAIEGVFGQELSFRDARQDFFDALTSPQKADREKKFGHLFQTLGQVVHHVEDMAQPQHVRNDPHLDSPAGNFLCPLPMGALCVLYLGLKNPSAFEKYTKDHPDRAGPTYGYPTVFGPSAPWSVPRDFWQSGTRGLAEFTNRNFVSAGTNFDSGRYVQPGFDPARRRDYTIAELCARFPGAPCPSVSGTVTMFATTVTDSFTGGFTSNDFASTLSLFDADLEKKGKSYVFSLNRFNFEAALSFVVPRAVAYSAGLLDYFFRGDVDLVEDPDSRGFLLRNASPDEVSGTFALYYDALDDTRRPVPGARWTRTLAGTPDPAKPVSSDAVAFSPPGDAKTPGRYVLVFTGGEGAEVPISGSLGSVIGRIVNVRHVPEGLFVAGLDAAGKTVYLRADASGTHVLTGSEFNPLALAPLPTSFFTPQTPDATRLYKFRQVSFGGSSPGYLTLALAFKNKPIGTGVYQIGGTLAYEPKSRGYAFVNEPSWVAQSPDPALGRFVFTYHATSVAITYVRTYVDAGGISRSASGLVPLPAALTSYNVVSVNHIDSGKVFASPDGLSLSGFVKTLPMQTSTSTTGDFSTTVSSIDRVEGELRFTLAAPPTAALVENTVRQLNARIDRGNYQTQIGTWSTGPPAGCFDPRNIDAFTCTFPGFHFYDSYVSHQDQKTSTPIGWFGGAQASYGWSYRFDVNNLTDYTGANCSMPACEPPAVCCAPSKVWVRIEYSGAHDDRNAQDGSFGFADGSLPAIQTSQTLYEDKNLHYEGCHDGAPTFPPKVTTYSSFEQNVRRALTPKAGDALTDARTNNEGFRFYFRGMDITGLFEVGDASPLGEVFFATGDMSIVIHEPQGGRMPRIVIPPNVVKLIAAIWM